MNHCVGCGYCCKQAACTLGLFNGSKSSSPCDFLIFKDGRYWCRLLLEGVVSGDQIYAGAGCCSSLNTDRLPYLQEEQDVRPNKDELHVREEQLRGLPGE